MNAGLAQPKRSRRKPAFTRVLFLFAVLLLPSWARAKARQEISTLGWLDARRPLTDTTWVAHYVLENQRLAMDDAETLALALERFRRPWVAGLPDASWFARGRYGPAAWGLAPLSWDNSACGAEPAGGSWPGEGSQLDAAWLLGVGGARFGFTRPSGVRLLDAWLSMSLAPEPIPLQIKAIKGCPSYQRPRAVTLLRTDGGYDRLTLLECDGSVSAETLDRFSVLLRPVGVPRPELPLPVEPDATRDGEWVDGVKLVHPRLVWAVQRVAQAFPWRAITIFSGYRREDHGYHPKGQAIDLFVHGVDNKQLFAFCRSLHDVGCGYYPNNKFVHIDVRRFGSQHPSWIDVAKPGEPSRYVDHWPGLDAPPTTISPNH